MSLLGKLATIVEECEREYENQKRQPESPDFITTEQFRKDGENQEKVNLLAQGENDAFMMYLMEKRKLKGKLKLIYLDPPFFSKANYGTEVKLKSDQVATLSIKQRAYHDTWENGMEEYLKMIAYRLRVMKDLLTEDGGIWIHLDWHAVHYVKVIADEIFGAENFINEIIWNYKSGGVSKKHFARKHDTLLYYGKTKNYFFLPQKEKSYNRGYKPYRFQGVKEYQDELGWYTLVNKKDVWQIDMVGRTSSERTGYATQKPEALLRRILESCTEKGDLCADFFGGSGTLAAVAAKMERKWISCDIGRLSVSEMKKRMWRCKENFDCLEQSFPLNRTEEKGTVEMEVSGKEVTGTEFLQVTIVLKSYSPPTCVNHMLEKGAIEEIATLKGVESLKLVDYWFVDEDYNRKIFCPKDIKIRTKGQLEMKWEGSVPKGHLIGIKIFDLFGGSVCATLLPEQGEQYEGET